MNIKQKFLLIYPILIVGTMILLFPQLTEKIGEIRGFVISNVIYWILCGIPCYVVFRGNRKLKEMLTLNISKHKVFTFLTILPAMVTGYVSFIPVLGKASPIQFLLAAVLAVINGTVEEIYWRGTYAGEFKRFNYAFLYPTIMFTVWHTALTLTKGIEFKGGDYILLAGAALAGVLYGLTAYKTKTLGLVIFSHVLTNFFGFSGMLFDNRFIW